MSMMSPKKAKKNKEREKEAKKKVLARRAALRAPKIEENKLKKKMKRIGKLQMDMGDLNVWADDIFMKMVNADEKTLSQLERNTQILKALEEEYVGEKARKDNLNSGLEAKGCTTLEEKLNHLHQQLVEDQKASGEEILAEEIALAKSATDVGLAGNAECAFKSKPKKEVAEVTICKAPVLDSEVQASEENE